MEHKISNDEATLICNKALETYGPAIQKVVAMEECGELIQAISKSLRDKDHNVEEEIAQVRCVGCKDDYRQCSIHKALDDASVPYCGEEPNCPYAADLSKFSLKEKKHIEELKEKIHKKNQFYKEA